MVNKYTGLKFNEQVVLMSLNELEQGSNFTDVINDVDNVSFKAYNPQFYSLQTRVSSLDLVPGLMMPPLVLRMPRYLKDCDDALRTSYDVEWTKENSWMSCVIHLLCA